MLCTPLIRSIESFLCNKWKIPSNVPFVTLKFVSSFVLLLIFHWEHVLLLVHPSWHLLVSTEVFSVGFLSSGNFNGDDFVPHRKSECILNITFLEEAFGEMMIKL